MAHLCFKCQKEVSSALGWNALPGRTQSCPHCSSDLHVCFNCAHHDAAAYNECREPQAERVLDKGVSNFCDYFAFREGAGRPDAKPGKEGALKKLDDLFKK